MASTQLEGLGVVRQFLFLLGREAKWLCPLLSLLGSPCLLPPQSPCTFHRECGSLWCRSLDHECFSPLEAGKPCHSHDECLGRRCSGLEPRPNAPQTTTTTTSTAVSTAEGCGLKELGTYCGDGSECLSGNCQRFDCFFFLVLDCWNVCVPATARGRSGELCTHSDQCTSGICATSNSIGEYECKDAAVVEEEGRCGDDLKALGVACSAGSECRSGNCQHYDCAFLYVFNCWSACVPAIGQGRQGDFCTKEDQCTSGICGDSNRVGDKECKSAPLGPASSPSNGPTPQSG